MSFVLHSEREQLRMCGTVSWHLKTARLVNCMKWRRKIGEKWDEPPSSGGKWQ